VVYRKCRWVSRGISYVGCRFDEGFRIVKTPWPERMYKPKHILQTDEWVTGETPEETAARETAENAPQPESDAEKTDRLETELTSWKLVAQQAQATANANSTDLQGLMDYLAETGVI
jgi:hypothetical protein